MIRKRIMLIEPPFLRLSNKEYSLSKYPLGLGYLTAAIKTHTDWDVLAYNCDFSAQRQAPQVTYLTGQGFQNYRRNLDDLSQPIWQEIQKAIADYEPSVVGISAKSPTYAAARAVAQLVKALDARILVLLGGTHSTIVQEQVLACPDIDVCVVGEGERTLVELLNAVDGRDNFENVHGIIYRDGLRIVTTPPRELIEDLDSLSFPHLFAPEALKDYAEYPPKALRHIYSTRGCPHNCTFCASRTLWGGRVRMRSPGNVASEIQSLREQGLDFVHFDDEQFGISPRHLKTLTQTLSEQCPGVRWSCETHVRMITEENVSLMKRAGCYLIQLGIESGNDQILNAMHKGFTLDEAFAACEIVNRHDISLETFFIVGYPLETEQTLQDTRAAIEKVDCDKLVYSIFTPYPGTQAYALCQANGLIDQNFEAAFYHHQSPANAFCLYISPKRFRSIVTEIETIVDAKNKAGYEKRQARYARWFGSSFESA